MPSIAEGISRNRFLVLPKILKLIAIIWDLSRYTYVKHLSGHVGPVAAVTIDELVGNIVTCAGSWLYLWDINGKPIAPCEWHLIHISAAFLVNTTLAFDILK